MTLRVDVQVAIGDSPSASYFGMFDAVTTKLLASREEFNEICREELADSAEGARWWLDFEWHSIAPVVTGEYERGIRTEVTQFRDSVAIDAWNEAPHAGFVERGTRRGGTGYIQSQEFSEETGKRKKLRFEEYVGPTKTGKWVFANRVRGQRPQRVLSRAHAAAKPNMIGEFREGAHRAKQRARALLKTL